MKHAAIVGAFEHPLRLAPEKSTMQLHAESALGALRDAGLRREDVDGYFCAGDAPGFGPMTMVEYMNLDCRHVDTTEIGGSAYLAHVAHAAQAIAAGDCNVALVTMAGRPRSEQMISAFSSAGSSTPSDQPFELPYGPAAINTYAMCAMRHMHEFGTTSEQLAWIRVAASHHARHNVHAVNRDLVTVQEVLSSPVVADPLHRLDCCMNTDGGGAIVLARPEIAKSLRRPVIAVRGTGEFVKHQSGGRVDLSYSAARHSGHAAFASANLRPQDIRYASIYDSFTITVLMQIEDLGFCEKGKGGAFVADGRLISGIGRLAVNTDGGGLCNSHPAGRGGMPKIVEAVRQLRGEAHPAVQVPDCSLALVQGLGGSLGSRHGSATLLLERI
jgi:acetyl-CoA C-acetyltransferase